MESWRRIRSSRLSHRMAALILLESGDHHGQQSSSLDRSVLAAQTANEQQSIQRPHPKPAILARDLMNAPAVSLPSDSTLLDAWGIMSERDSTFSLSLRCMAHSLGWYRIEIYFIMCPN